MRVVLVPSPTTTPQARDASVPISHPAPGNILVPVGLIMLATVLDRSGTCDVRILDIHALDAVGHPEELADAILALDPDVVGFSSMCASYHVTLNICAACKRRRPSLFTLLGGPQATATAAETVRRFPHVDLVVRGECEHVILDVFRSLPDRKRLAGMPGVTFMDGDRLVSTQLPPPVRNLDDLPLPDYTLCPGVRSATPLPVEVGRGCPADCSFCCRRIMSRGSYRLFSPQRVVDQIRELVRATGTRHFLFLHDTISHDRDWLMELCSSIRESGLDIAWRSSARVDEVDSALLATMAAAGCTGLFFGIESGSSRVQRQIGKPLKLDMVPANISETIRQGIRTTASFIVGFPDEEMADVAQTIRLAMACLFAPPARPGVQLHLLAPLVGSRLMRQYGDGLAYDGVFTDFSPESLSEPDLATIRAFPHLFSVFHHYPTPRLPRAVWTRTPFLFMNLCQMINTAFWLWKEPRFGYPESLLTNPFIAMLPWRFHEEGETAILKDIDAVAAFLQTALRASDMEDHPLVGLIRYDRAMMQAELCGSAMEHFDCDIAWAVRHIRESGFTSLPADVPRRKTTLFFKREERRITVRLIAAPLSPPAAARGVAS